jgi:hypothetical protein
MSSLGMLNPSFRPNVARLVTVAGFAALLAVLGFFVPFWIVLVVAAVMAVIGRLVRALRAASRKIDQIMAEELPSKDAVR